MESAKDTTTSTSREKGTVQASDTGTEAIAAQLESAGFDLTRQAGTPVDDRTSSKTTAFIELTLSHEDLSRIKQIIDDTNTAVAHRLITPKETTTLSGWQTDSRSEPSGQRVGTVLIVPSTHGFPSFQEKAERWASAL